MEARGGNVARNAMSVMAVEELFKKYEGVHKSKVSLHRKMLVTKNSAEELGTGCVTST